MEGIARDGKSHIVLLHQRHQLPESRMQDTIHSARHPIPGSRRMKPGYISISKLHALKSPDISGLHWYPVISCQSSVHDIFRNMASIQMSTG